MIFFPGSVLDPVGHLGAVLSDVVFEFFSLDSLHVGQLCLVGHLDTRRGSHSLDLQVGLWHRKRGWRGKLTLVDDASWSSCSAVICTSAGILFFTLATLGIRAFFAGGGSILLASAVDQTSSHTTTGLSDACALHQEDVLNNPHHQHEASCVKKLVSKMAQERSGKKEILPWGLTTDTLKPNSVQVLVSDQVFSECT